MAAARVQHKSGLIVEAYKAVVGGHDKAASRIAAAVAPEVVKKISEAWSAQNMVALKSRGHMHP